MYMHFSEAGVVCVQAARNSTRSSPSTKSGRSEEKGFRLYIAMVSTSKVRIFNAGEVNVEILAERALAVLRRKPFPWQLEIAEAILQGEDVIIDVGTGSGKTLCFALPLLTNETDMVIVVSPLTALMVDQVRW
jgi:ATP-dependent helicase YprA (DUF1998 family)